jgi:hypothetical protein
VKSFKDSIVNVAFAYGSTHAFIVGAIMIWVGAIIAVLFMRVSHEELNDTEVSEAVAVG